MPLTASNREAAAELSPALLEVLVFCFTHRYVTAEQVARHFALASKRTAQHRLKRLVDRRYIASVPIRYIAPTYPHVYVATTRGASLLRRRFEDRTGRLWRGGRAEQRRSARGYGMPYVAHEVGVTDIDIHVTQIARRSASTSLLTTERRYHRPSHRLRYEASSGGGIEPDAGYFLMHERHGRRWLDLCWLEFDRANAAPDSFRRKLERYEQFAASEAGRWFLSDVHRRSGDRSTTRPEFRLLVVTQARPGEGDDWHRLVTLISQSLELSPAMHRRLWWTTFAAVRNAAVDQPVWLRGRDLQRFAWNNESRDQASLRAGRQGARRFLARRLADARRYTLLLPP